MDKNDRTYKLNRLYERVQRMIQLHKGSASPSEINVAQSVLREIEELTLRVENDENYSFKKYDMHRLNQLWKDYKS